MTERAYPTKSAEAYRTISEVAEELRLPQHVLRFWETRFSQVKPLKRAGGRRFYRPEDVALLRAIKTLLYGEGYTIKGVQRMLQEHGPRGVAAGLAVAEPSRGRGPPIEGEGGAGTGSDGSRLPEVGTVAPRLPRPPPARSPAPSEPMPARGPGPGSGSADLIARLEAVAFDLSECGRLLGSLCQIRDGG